MLLFFLNAGTLLPISGLTKYPLHKKEKPGFVLKSTQKVQKVQIQYKSLYFYCILRNTLVKMRTFHAQLHTHAHARSHVHTQHDIRSPSPIHYVIHYSAVQLICWNLKHCGVKETSHFLVVYSGCIVTVTFIDMSSWFQKSILPVLFIVVLGSVLWRTLRTHPKISISSDDCDVYMASSSIEGTGRGIFVGKNMQVNEPITPPSPVIHMRLEHIRCVLE
jgi:hypothetical protein